MNRGHEFAGLAEGVLRARLGPHTLSVSHDAERGVWTYRVAVVRDGCRYTYRRDVSEQEWHSAAPGPEWEGLAVVVAGRWADDILHKLETEP